MQIYYPAISHSFPAGSSNRVGRPGPMAGTTPIISYKEKTMTKQRALSRRQFAESGFDAAGYAFNEERGLHTGIIDCKR